MENWLTRRPGPKGLRTQSETRFSETALKKAKREKPSEKSDSWAPQRWGLCCLVSGSE